MDTSVLERTKEIRKLLDYFDANLVGWDPGVLFHPRGNPNFTVDVNGPGWDWLEPLLVELQSFREMVRNRPYGT